MKLSILKYLFVSVLLIFGKNCLAEPITIGMVGAAIIGGDYLIGKASDEAKENINLMGNKAKEIVDLLDQLSKKRITEADAVVKARLGQFNDIMVDFDKGIKSSLDKVDNSIKQTLSSLEKLKNDLISDIDHIFDKIYGVLNEVDCMAMGQLMTVEMMTDKFFKKVDDSLDFKTKFVSLFKKKNNIKNNDQTIRPAVYYSSMKKLLNSMINEKSPSEEILSIYAELSLLAKRMHCLYRGQEAQELYTRDFVEFEMKMVLWKKAVF